MKQSKRELLKRKGSYAKAAFEAGGELITATLPPLRTGQNGGCGAPTHVTGTNGGTMPCGSILNSAGKKSPYYCPLCEANR